jgi:rare lipoprotein A
MKTLIMVMVLLLSIVNCNAKTSKKHNNVDKESKWTMVRQYECQRRVLSKDFFTNFVQEGIASFYHEPQITATGERFNKNELTAAHKLIPLNSIVRVTNLRNNKSVVVRINDRGPYKGTRIIDLSQAAAEHIGISVEMGLGKVKVEIVSIEGRTTTPIIHVMPRFHMLEEFFIIHDILTSKFMPIWLSPSLRDIFMVRSKN